MGRRNGQFEPNNLGDAIRGFSCYLVAMYLLNDVNQCSDTLNIHKTGKKKKKLANRHKSNKILYAR